MALVGVLPFLPPPSMQVSYVHYADFYVCILRPEPEGCFDELGPICSAVRTYPSTHGVLTYLRSLQDPAMSAANRPLTDRRPLMSPPLSTRSTQQSCSPPRSLE